MAGIAKNKTKVKRILTAAVIAIGIAAICIFFLKSFSRGCDHIGKVNSEPVSAKFFSAELNKERAETYSYFKKKYGVDDSAGFWTTSYGGEVPAEFAKKNALDACVRIMVQLELARKENLVQDISYEKFLKGLEEENKKRKKAVAQNKVIYGPVEYSEDSYLQYVLSNMVIQLKHTLGEKELAPSDRELREIYESRKDMYREEYIKVNIISIPFAGDGGVLIPEKKEGAKTRIEEIEARLKNGEKFEDLAVIYNQDRKLKELVFDSNSRRNDLRKNAGLRNAASKLSPGQISGILENSDSESIIKCMENKFTGYKTFDEVKDSIKTLYIDQKYDELIDKMVKEAKVEIDKKAYRSVSVR